MRAPGRLAIAGLLAFGLAGTTRSQAVLHPNQIVGSVRWSNTNPTIRGILDGRGDFWWHVWGKSEGPPVELSASVGGSNSRGSEVDRYELTVETSPAGIPYRVAASLSENPVWGYRFAGILSAPVRSEPEPDVVVDFSECAGLVRVIVPASVTGGQIEAWRDGEGTYGDNATRQASRGIEAGETEPAILVRGDGCTYSFRVRFDFGTDGFLDRLRYEARLSATVHCDEIVVLDLVSGGGSGGGGVPGVDPSTLGHVFGTYDVVGEREIPDALSIRGASRTLVSLDNGPWDNDRFDDLVGDPACGAYDLPNVMPSTVVSPPQAYMLFAHSWLRGGPYMQDYRSPTVYVTVGESEEVDLGDTLVLEPGWVHGDIQIAGPARSGSFGSVLDHVRLSGSTDPDWIPPWGSLSYSSVWVGGTESAFPGEADPGTAEFLGDYETVVTRLGPGPWSVAAGSLYVDMYRRPSPPEPDDDVDCQVSIGDRAPSLAVSPGARTTFDRRYCASQVNLFFLATSGTFCDPKVFNSRGSFAGRDFLGRDVGYDVGLNATGLPLSIDPGPEGRVTMGLPQGTYVLDPWVTAINPVDGDRSTTQILPVLVTVGCRQVIDLYPELGVQIGVNDVPPCAEAGLVHVSGSVRSVDAVARVEWRVQGGANGVICTDCGVSPAFEADVPLEDRDNDIVFTATDVVGRTASVNAFSQWAPEPSALDRRPGSQPLLVAKDDAGGLVITLESRAPSNVYRGTIDSLHRGSAYDHRGIGACDVSSGRLVLAAESGSVYFVASGTCAWGDGSVGRDSFGRERPPARDRCP